MTFFPAFFDHPAHMRFADQEEDEHIDLLLRRHFITNVPWILVAVVLILLPVLISNFRGAFAGFGVSIPPEIIAAALILWYLFVLAHILTNFLHWYFNIYIITNTHLVDIDFHNLLSRDKTEVRLDDVQSAKSSFRGILGPLFNFGDIVIETAAERQKIDFLAVPKPDFVADRIQDLQERQEGPGDVT